MLNGANPSVSQVDAIVTGVNYEGFLAMAGPLQLFVSREVRTVHRILFVANHRVAHLKRHQIRS